MYSPLSDSVEVWHFDLRAPPEDSETKTVDLTFGCDGRMNAVAFWFRLQLTESISFSTGPDAVAAGDLTTYYAVSMLWQDFLMQ